LSLQQGFMTRILADVKPFQMFYTTLNQNTSPIPGPCAATRGFVLPYIGNTKGETYSI
jgi:hypothetical protein